MTRVTRRALLIGGLALTTVGAGSDRLADPFTLGVASGDPTFDSVVLWTRLAPTPLAEDGAGGMPSRAVEVKWEIALDERFRRVIRRGKTYARPEEGHSVHVDVRGLLPGREYFYRFAAEGHLSRTGRTRTALAPWALGSGLTMAFASCSQFEHGYFTAYRRLAEDQPDLVLHLGDYQYEYTKGAYVAPGGNPRDHEGPETETLANYRQRHAQYKTDLDLQEAHAVAPWAVVWDDHEIDNNWADEVYEKPQIPQPNFLARRAAAFQAYYENMPIRSKPSGIDLQLYRRLQWGGLANFHLLDTRQYRDDQACGDGLKACPERLEPTRTITGAAQEKWLLDGLKRSHARWDVLGQQVFFSQLDFTPGVGETNNMDAWDGYAANRDRVAAGFCHTRNTVVLTGDVHAAWAADVKERWNDPTSRTVATELVSTSITSGGDGSETRPETPAILAENPHVKYFNNRRGYVRTKFTAREVRADFRGLDYVRTPGAPVTTKASFVIEDRSPGLHKA
ncbi:alkaline phosphatase D [Lentzea waywayandensis]|uniref:Alkaline phosphatase D n=1 Tax=Lentzea waywayandensis TaxID=84724 RepID=A0A1I6DUJ2_9PSEU|nr:alkaline phosphatase D family protein [Lentzea waywayandensis]SFR09180.1 alkaline phosphatase D [Lentzea waywayandensis]